MSSHATTMQSLQTALRARQIGPYVCSTCTRQLRRQRRRYATTTALNTPDIYDVVCVGGGPAGLSLLAALRMSNFNLHATRNRD